MMSRYAISDIHGCAKTFRFMVEEELKLTKYDSLYLLGDYIDRGPDSKGVIDFILELRQKGFKVTTLCGNHEEMLLDAREDQDYLNQWLVNGGLAALKSFQTSDLSGIPDKYWNFIYELELYVELSDFWLVHAGFNFSISDPFQDDHAMLWIRDFEVDKAKLGNRKIVHGHTPISLNMIKYTLTKPVSHVINIDGGCVFTSTLGYLTALNLDTFELHALKNRENY